jgi:hypothetical protein
MAAILPIALLGDQRRLATMINPEQMQHRLMRLMQSESIGYRYIGDFRIDDWRPQMGQCHDNISTAIRLLGPDHTSVRGWLLMEYPGFDHIRLVAHSILRAPDGQLVDITPRREPHDRISLRFFLHDADEVDFMRNAVVGYLDVRLF